MDLRGGFEAWLSDRSAVSANFRRAWRKAEALLRAETTVIEHDVVDPGRFERLIELKQDAYARAGHFDIFQLSWPRTLLEQLLQSDNDNARGVFSTLKIDGEVAAVSICMRSAAIAGAARATTRGLTTWGATACAAGAKRTLRRSARARRRWPGGG